MRNSDRKMPVWVDSQPSLREWYASDLGQSILILLEEHLETILPAVFGYQGLQLGTLGSSASLLDKAGLHRPLVLESPKTSLTTDSPPTAHLSADVLNLPIASDVMKIVLLPHTLDFCSDPYQALREADRVLTGDGHMVIIGFSPYSLFGMRRLLQWRSNEPWNGRFYSRHRVVDWLSVLNYRVHHSQAFYLRPPLQSGKLLGRLRLLEKNQRWLGLLGAVYLLHAKKQTLPLTPSKRVWLPKRAGIRAGSFARTHEPGAASTSVAPVTSATVRRIKNDEHE